MEILKNALIAICEEMGITLARAAYSLLFTEGGDFSCGIFDSNGNLVAQGNFTPVHLAAMHFSVKLALDKIGVENVEEGDIIISNDTFLGGTHLSDVTLMTPVFVENELQAFVANRAHYADIGGKTPGGAASDSTEVYTDGLRIPPTKIAERGKLREDVIELMIANMRLPRERRGDLQATIAANKAGLQRSKELITKYGKEVFRASLQALINYVERRTRLEIGKIKNGAYDFRDFIDNDGITDKPILIEVKMEVMDDTITFDFSGCAKQSKGPANLPFAQTAGTVYLTFKAFTDPTIPVNSGFYKPIQIVAPEGSIVNPAFPASTAASNEVCARVCDVVMGALSKAIPERGMGTIFTTMDSVVISGEDTERNQPYICSLLPIGGWGARAMKDGVSAFYCLPANGSLLPVETVEMKYPILGERRELRKDSGGPGKYRGGLGCREDYRIMSEEATLDLLGDRTKFPPPGSLGGKPGKPAMFRLIRHGKERNISPLGWKLVNFRLRRDDIISMRTGGGGGYGDPSQRDSNALKEDIINGYISRKSALTEYGKRSRIRR